MSRESSPSNHTSSAQRMLNEVEIIDRFTAFHDYSRSTSWKRVAFVCLKALAPSFFVTILLTSMPLAPPSEGWSENWMFWIQDFLSCCFVSFGIAIQFQMIVPDAALETKHLVFIAVLASSGKTLQLIPVAYLWVFPLPFAMLVATPGWQSSFIAGIVLTTGMKNFMTKKELQKQCQTMYIVVSIQSALVLIYPAYNAVFLALKGHAQTAFIIVLPVMKFCMKRVLTKTIGHLDAGMVLVVTSVELFDMLYLFKCMQAAGSRISGIILILVDLGINIFHLWHLHHMGRIVLANMAADGELVTTDVKDLIQTAIHAANRSLGSMKARREMGPRNDQPALLEVAPQRIPAQRNYHPSAVQPVSDPANAARVLGHSVQMLIIECEQIMVVEFMECVVPMFYVLCTCTLYFFLPNARYYPELERMTSAKFTSSVSNIGTFGAMEIVSLLYVHVMFQWRFGISALHLLAFMLKNQNWLLQGVFMTWVPMVMQYTLQHYGTRMALSISYWEWLPHYRFVRVGADLTLHFDWIA